jgi:DTW domain-containing protein YfiP
MNVETYRRRRRLLADQPGRRMRSLCFNCLQPVVTCFCRHLRPFDPGYKFVILIHALELRRRIATGRMAHLCLRDSVLLLGYDYSENSTLNGLLSDPQYCPVVLYPGQDSLNLTNLTTLERRQVFPSEKKPLVVVIDGTWSTAKKMLRRSRNLRDLPRICFTPDKPSRFRVRQQPKKECLSTIEAIHQTLDLLRPSADQDALVYVFDKMVEQQLAFIEESKTRRRRSRHSRFQDILEVSQILE